MLGFPVRRPASNASLRNSSALRRRIVVGVLAVLALALITVSFRSSDDGPVNGAHDAAATVLHPFQVAVERVARPFRDAWGWSSDLVHARSEAERLQDEVRSLRQQVVQNESALQQNVDLKALLDYRAGPTFPSDFRGLATEVAGYPPNPFRRDIVIAAGANDGVRVGAPVVNDDGLVGQVTRVFSNVARVTLLTDERSAVSALDLRTRATGIVLHGRGADTLVMDRVSKKQFVKEGDEIVTSGWRSGDIASIYPRDIPIGVVTSVGMTDTDLYQQVQIQPYVDFESLRAVLVLVPKDEAEGR